ncbi:MAG: hypothetical protein KJ676_08950 [Alphaproteobacteria bacterium]|nr:hypothetical protein [Alphaproteobacteria bacterium]MBU1525475.1 hypothetical protein [Alphaproteobacteria bacterium]MBU2116313.1 hypothetical protein [Alphaproteobacteria bacterium]MBU2350877.1 hypothetical protein [Alphaproteobacteria bacterium]MBU2381742.1 hypothetical protein [Alphaproteobacteria bacterium]
MTLETTFASATTFRSEAELREAFGSDRIFSRTGAEVTLSGRVVLGVDVSFAGVCKIEGPADVGAGCQLTTVALGAGATVRAYSILSEVTVGERAVIGPFAFLRDGVTAGDGCILGAHVEAARSRFGSGVKVSHRAFIGDAEVDDDVILGAGTTFCNFDGEGRRFTRVGRGVSIGSGSLLVAPLTIGDGAVIGAGSTLTRDVPAGARIIQKRTSQA